MAWMDWGKNAFYVWWNLETSTECLHSQEGGFVSWAHQKY